MPANPTLIKATPASVTEPRPSRDRFRESPVATHHPQMGVPGADGNMHRRHQKGQRSNILIRLLGCASPPGEPDSEGGACAPLGASPHLPGLPATWPRCVSPPICRCFNDLGLTQLCWPRAPLPASWLRYRGDSAMLSRVLESEACNHPILQHSLRGVALGTSLSQVGKRASTWSRGSR